MNLKMLSAILFSATLVPICVVAQAKVSDPSIESLRGLKTIALVVGRVQTVSLPVNAKPDTPTVDEVRTEAEFWLKKLGINLVNTESQKGPLLHLTFVAEKDNNGGNHFDITVTFIQEVTLVRDPSVKVRSPTWSRSLRGFTSGHKPFEGLVCRAIVPFVTAYNSVNAPDKMGLPGDESSVCLFP